jgi:hypothetical protein
MKIGLMVVFARENSEWKRKSVKETVGEGNEQNLNIYNSDITTSEMAMLPM